MSVYLPGFAWDIGALVQAGFAAVHACMNVVPEDRMLVAPATDELAQHGLSISPGELSIEH